MKPIRTPLLLATLLLLVAALPQAARAEVVAVTIEADVEDGDTSSISALLADPGPDGEISLREALRAANNTPGIDDVTFLIGGTVGQRTIQLTSALPPITSAIRIVGTCAGTPCVELRGAGTGGFDGLVITAGASAVEGLLLNRFKTALVLGSGGHVIKRCYIGVEHDGATAAPNEVGIRVESGSNTIGTGLVGEGNVIAGNTGDGVLITGASATSNRVLGNFIGTDRTGQDAVGNGTGVRIAADATSNVVGGTSEGRRNVIAGNVGSGIHLLGSGNDVVGNFIGTDAAGTGEVGNGVGVHIAQGTSGNTVGGTNFATLNLISGNTGDGIQINGTDNRVLGNFIGTDRTGQNALGNDIGIHIGSSGSENVVGGTSDEARNVISGNRLPGLLIRGKDNVVEGNYIGLNVAGSAALGNGQEGVFIEGGTAGNRIGGTSQGSRNVISGNARSGVAIESSFANRVLGNYIGLNAAGTAARPNARHGVFIRGGENNVVGGGSPGSRNVISGNAQSGVALESSRFHRVVGNYIGTIAAGDAALGNGEHGVVINTGQGHFVGGDSPGEGNVIAGNVGSGIAIENGDGNLVRSNVIGLNAVGDAALGNGEHGVFMRYLEGDQTSGNVVGGEVSSARNVIAGNAQSGVAIEFGARNEVLGNFIGTTASGSVDLGNGDAGVRILEARTTRVGRSVLGGPGNVIGFNRVGIEVSGSGSISGSIMSNRIGVNGAGGAIGNDEAGILIRGGAKDILVGGDNTSNVIAHNGGSGVVVLDETTTEVDIRANQIYSNGGLGIDLGGDGVTSNDDGDGDSGPNYLVNFPVLNTASVASGGGVVVEGVHQGAPFEIYMLEFYSNTAPDPSGHGEGEFRLGTLAVTTDASGEVPFTFTGPGVSVGHVVTATAFQVTAILGGDEVFSTSEFSNAVAVTDDTPSQTVEYANLTGDGDPTNPNNYVGGKGPTANDNVNVRAGSTAMLPAGKTLQVNEIDIAGPGTVFDILGTFVANVISQFSNTEVVVNGGEVTVEETWDVSDATATVVNGATVTGGLGGGAVNMTSGATLNVEGAGNTIGADFTSTNTTISGASNSDVSFTGNSIWGTGTDLLNMDPNTGEFLINLNGPLTVAGDTDVDPGVTVNNYSDLSLGADLRAGNGGAGLFVNHSTGTVDVTGTGVTLSTILQNFGAVNVPAGNPLTLTGGGDLNGDGIVSANDVVTFTRNVGSSVVYNANGVTFTGNGDLNVRAPLNVGNGTSFGSDLTVHVNRSEAAITRTGTEMLALPNVEVIGTGGVIYGGNPTPTSTGWDVTIQNLTGNPDDQNVSGITFANGGFWIMNGDVPTTSTLTDINLNNAYLNLAGSFDVNDSFELNSVPGSSTHEVVVDHGANLNVENGATLTLNINLTVEQDATVNVEANSVLRLRGRANFQGLNDPNQLILGSESIIEVGASFGNTSTVNFSNVPTGPDDAAIRVTQGGEVDFSGNQSDAPLHIEGGSVLPGEPLVLTRPFLWKSGQVQRAILPQGGLSFAGSSIVVNSSITLPEGAKATILPTGTVQLNGVLTVAPGGELEVQRGGTAITGSGGVVNEGGVHITSTSPTVFNAPFTGASGSGITLGQPGTPAGLTFNAFSGSSGLFGNGNIGGNGLAYSTIGPGLSPGALTIAGDYAMPAGSELVVEILDDEGPGTGHDVLHVEGDLVLAGTLRVIPLGPAPPGDYAILTFTGTLSGTFEAVELPGGGLLLFPGDPGGMPGAVILRADSVLPVELSSFEAVLAGEAVVLQWRTESETNNAGFEIQRSIPANEETGEETPGWEVLTFVEGHGTTAEAQTYRFTDTGLPFAAPAARYRLKQIDYDGTFAYSPEVELALALPARFTLHGNYPNPFNPSTEIRYELPRDTRVRLAVYDALGREVAILVDAMQQAGRHQVRFDAAHLASGLYFYRIETGAFTQTRRMVLIK